MSPFAIHSPSQKHLSFFAVITLSVFFCQIIIGLDMLKNKSSNFILLLFISTTFCDGSSIPHEKRWGLQHDVESALQEVRTFFSYRYKISLRYLFFILTCFHLTNFFWRRKIQLAAFFKGT